jgi:tetratricopeptide (TPR) repeat protein
MSDKNKSNWQKEFRFLLPLILIAFLVFANSLNGEFVYDDSRQIVRNPLIQDVSLYGKALTSDVWAFKGDGTISASNYWRPTFVAWMILNFQLFGLNPFGWHLLNILLHVGICALGFLLLRRWGLSQILAFAITLIFAVHPIHTETVAWISGSPDLLFGLFLLASLWFAGNYAEKRHRLDVILALLFYAFALGAKEVAFLCFPLFWFVFDRERTGKSKNKKSGNAIAFTLPFLILAILYFIFRWIVLGEISHTVADSPNLLSAILTVPLAFIFYLKQILFPLSLGVNYSLRPLAGFDLLNFVLPLILSIAAFVLFLLLAKRSFVQKIGFLLFLLPLIPVMNITAFPFEQIVHDRYLYLSLLGFLMLVVPYLKDLIEKFSKEKAGIIVLIFAILISIPLSIKTFFYNQVWKNDLVLWEHSVKIDDRSSFNWSQFGAELAKQQKNREAIEAFNNSLDIKPNSQAYLGKARSNLALNRLEEAVFDLKTVTEMQNQDINAYTLYQTYEALAIAYTNQQKYIEAIQTLLEARKRLPIYYAALTGKLAVVYFLQGNKELALRVLEETRIQVKTELLPESKRVLFLLGDLYLKVGQKEKAKEVLQEYLKLTNTFQDKSTLEDRNKTLDLLEQLN